ncbi:MAG TPA: cupin domain-containing protein [Gaiellaceae bacterium]|jgi:uncharacterized cupin superfamily protein
MKIVNIGDPEFDYSESEGQPEGFGAGGFRIGKLVGAELTGTTVYELPPGQAICPYHYEYGEEEWLLVLQGRPTLRHPEGTTELEPWDIVCFPSGPDGAHAVRNTTEDTVRVLMYANLTKIGAVVYPDSDKLAVWTPDSENNLRFRRSTHLGYWDGETGDRA